MTALTTQRPWILDDPSRMLARIIDEGRARIGHTLIAAVGRDSRELLGVRRIPTPAPRPTACYDESAVLRAGLMLTAMGASDSIIDPDLELARQLEAVVDELVPHDGLQVVADVFTVVCREGYVVQTATEAQFRCAWRRARLRSASDGDVYVVTPHGWTGFMDERAGLVPAVGVRPSLMVLNP